MNFSKPTFFIIILTLFISCSNESTDDSIITEDSGTLLRQRIFDYNGEIFTENFTYDASNNLTSILNSNGFRHEYLYENGFLKRINWTDSNGSLIDYTLLEYDNDGRLSSYTVYVIFGNEGLRFELSYNGDGTINEKIYSGDHTAQPSLINEGTISFDNGQILGETTTNYENIYEYDSRNGIFKNVNNIEVLNLVNDDFAGDIQGGANNLIRVTEIEDGSEIIYEDYEYTYNSSDYPDSATYLFEGEFDNIQYIYE